MADIRCIKCKYLTTHSTEYPCYVCEHRVRTRDLYEPRTNADHIRSMSDEELAEFLCGVFDEDECDGKYICGITISNYDEDKIAEWLKSEVKE